MPRLHVAWGSSHRWAGIVCIQVVYSDSEDSDSLLFRPSLLCRSLVGSSGIVYYEMK